MSAPIDVLATFQPTPEVLAAAFWEMSGEHQADFFAELERLAGIRLCFQMAFVVDVIRKRAERGDYSAMQGFQTMLNHAEGYADSASEYRASDAKRDIARIGAA